MKFNRVALLALLDEIEADARTAHEQKHKDAVAKYEASVKAWKETSAPALLAELRRCAESVRRGRHPGRTELTTNFGRNNIWGYIEEKPKVVEYRPNSATASLRRVLETTSDEEVSTSMLRDMGFGPARFIKAASR